MRVISTVVTPPNSTGLVTWSDVKLELNLPDAEQTWATGAISRVSALVNGYCDRVFGRQQIRDDFLPEDWPSQKWPTFGEPLVLSGWPVSAVTSVTVNGVALTVNVDYRIDADAGLLYRLDSVGNIDRWSCQTTSVTYSAGYVLPSDSGYSLGAAGSLPGDIADATLSLVTSRYFGRRRDPMLRSENVPDVGAAAYWVGSIGDGSMPANIAAILDSYVRPSV